MENIKTIVNDLDIPYKRARFRKHRDLILEIKHSMSNLALDRMVALYAHNLGLLEYETDEVIRKKAILANVMLLKQEPNVAAYESLRIKLNRLEHDTDYYKTIQVDLRDSLIDLQLPDIYVYQGLLGIDKMKLCRHIIIPGTYQTYENESEVGIVLLPKNKIESNRKLRRFYASTSFRYLEGLSNDHSFDLEGKKLGPVLIKK